LWTAPLLSFADISDVPKHKAIELVDLASFDDPDAWPNLAVLRFAAKPKDVVEQVQRLREQRSIIDLPSLVLPWLGFVWGAGNAGNPLLAGIGLPSAAFVETVHALGQIELTPSLASTASCPEAIWQSARYWYEYFRTTARDRGSRAIHPSGDYVVRQHSAAVRLPAKREAAAPAAPTAQKGAAPRARPRKK
jgi:hypothetical protein